jgi:hypothetical protein
MRRVNRSAILSNVSLKASRYENEVINHIDRHAQKERRDQVPAREPKSPVVHTILVWDPQSRQVTRSWSF